MAKSPTSDIDKQVGKRIQQCRKSHKLTAAILSERIDLSIQQLSRYERGINKIPLDHLVKISGELETPISWFFAEKKSNVGVLASNKLRESKEKYCFNQEDQKSHLLQRWDALTEEQKLALIILLDAM